MGIARRDDTAGGRDPDAESALREGRDAIQAQSGSVTIENVWKQFESRRASEGWVLHDVSIRIKAGEFVSIIGPSGCGKSTLLEIVGGLQQPTRGRVQVGGKPIAGPGPERTIVFQHYALFPWRTARANVTFPMELGGVPRAERNERAEKLLRMVSLHNVEDKYVHQLSGGMQQRLGLARALAADPQILLMDEPFSGADAITRESLQDLLKQLQAEFKRTVIFITHSVDEAMKLSDRIVVMGTKPGRILAEASGKRGREAGGESVLRSLADTRDFIAHLLRGELNKNPVSED